MNHWETNSDARAGDQGRDMQSWVKLAVVEMQIERSHYIFKIYFGGKV